MTIDPTEITPLSSLSAADMGMQLVTHGYLDTLELSNTLLLVETEGDYTQSRLPISVTVDNLTIPGDANSIDDDRAPYALVEAVLHPDEESSIPTFHSVRLDAESSEVFIPNDSHATERSQSEIHDMVKDVLTEYEEAVPTQFVIETCVERGCDRERLTGLLDRMVDAGHVYRPEQGYIGTL